METELKNAISTKQAWHYRILPISVENQTLVCEVDETKVSPNLENELAILLNRRVKLCPQNPDLIQKGLSQHYYQEKQQESIHVDVSKPESALENIIKEAFQIQSSDIHIEPRENNCLIRYRLDGKLIEKYVVNKPSYAVFLNKIKILSKLDISEKRLPQDGRLKLKFGVHEVDVRVSTLPTLFGEKAVLRILKKDASHLSIDLLGMDDHQRALFSKSISQHQGLILISGPTGSGKTTTLYSALKQLNTSSRNILTIEDPIEYTLEGLNQVQLRERIGLDFTKALKSFLRQDPDIIMVGEIRDSSTASMAFRASMTGHLVLSTIHTNSSWETIERLSDLGIPRYSIASTMVLSVAQRLIRKLCTNCKVEQKDSKDWDLETLKKYSIQEGTYCSVGCAECQHTGYKGRTAIYEMFTVDEEVRELIKTSESEEAFFKTKGITTIKEQAALLVRNRITSLEEVMPLLLAN